MKYAGLAISIIATGCMVNGKPIGPQLTTSSSTSTGTTSAPSREPGTLGSGFAEPEAAPADGQYHKLPPYPTAPADPWTAVNGDQPRRWSADDADRWVVRGNAADCSAAHDHCLDKDSWFIVRDSDLERSRERGIFTEASVHVFGPEEPAIAANAQSNRVGDPYTAFRTVPATRHNLAVGSIVIGLPRRIAKLASGTDAVGAYWAYGIVEDVDFDVGTYKIKGADDTARLTGARVVVLSWHPGEKVKIVGGKQRDQLAVNAADVFLPD